MKAHRSRYCLFLGVLFFGALVLCMTPCVSSAQEQPKVQPQADPAMLSRDRSNVVLVEELNKLVGGWAWITLNSGATFSGVVMKERDGLVHLAKVHDREYFDVLIRIADISALGARFSTEKK